MKSSFNAVAFLALFVAGSASPVRDSARRDELVGSVPPGSGQVPSQFQKRAMVCNADNALRALRATKRAAIATPFCQQYISIPTSTATVTVTPSTLISSTAIVTETDVYTEFAYETHVYTVTVDKTSIATVTETVVVPYQLSKRTEVPVPDFMQTYPASRISSACSCLVVPSPSTTVTATADRVTDYDISTRVTVLSVPTTFTIETSVTTEETRLVATVTTTETVSFTATPDSEFYIKSSGGSFVGQYLTPFANSNDDRNLFFTSDKTIATKFRLGADGIMSFSDSIRHDPPVEVRSFLNTGWQLESVYFSSAAALEPCVEGGSCYYITFSINTDKVLVSTNSNGVTQNRANLRQLAMIANL
ncbi:hypothetical protein B0I35DRAFT_490443 [Stachybotrys elegans]|uniref:Uncharacterized protein n=1 Tax=Stachybotrys elegans TaxID=80388 RepID=A0A8K0SJP4_9HYPO|nr:hypothetical protein B0I35DRAFT_490443 [Stachybotrys elegans]